MLLAGSLNLLELLLGLLVGIFLGLLESARVLQRRKVSVGLFLEQSCHTSILSPSRGSHLGLELLVFFLLLVAVLFDLLLGLGLGVPYPLGAICSGNDDQSDSACLSGESQSRTFSGC